MAAALGGCGYYHTDGESGETSRAASAEDADRLKSERGDSTAARIDLAAIFKDTVEFTVQELIAGKTNCRDVTGRTDIAAKIKPWPPELRDFLVSELRRFPAANLVGQSVFAAYLVDSEVLTDVETGTAAGLACDRGRDNMGILFLNYDSFVTDRTARGTPGQWQNLRVVTDRYVLQEAGDNAAVTFIHEALHAIDNKLFVHGAQVDRDRRQAIYEMSWSAYTTPKSKRISVYALTDDAATDLASGRKNDRTACRTAPKSGSETLALDDRTPQSLADELRYLSDRTNFVVPYTMASAAEDWAESLTVYHFGLNRSSWQIRTVYDQDLKQVEPANARALYRHDTHDVLTRVKAQRDKMCALANLVFGQCKL